MGGTGVAKPTVEPRLNPCHVTSLQSTGLWGKKVRSGGQGSLHPGDSQLDRQRLRTQKACVVPMRAGILRVAVLQQEERTLAYIHKQMFHSVGFRGSVPSIGGHQIDGVRRVCFSSPLKRGNDRSSMRGCV